MSSPRRRKPRKKGLSRREFLKRAGGGSVLLAAAPLLSSCGSSGDSVVVSGNPFQHGVASGDPLQDRVILWTRLNAAGGGDLGVDYVMAADPALAQIVRTGSAAAAAANDYTVKIDVSGLQPGTTYYYRFSTLGFDSPVGRTRTLPAGNVDRLRIGILSCFSLGHGYPNAVARVAQRHDLDFVLFLGDYIYEYSSGDDGKEVYGNLRRYEPGHEILTLGDYRTRYAQYSREPELQELRRQHPLIAVFDDHETADNAWMGGAVNHNPGEGDWGVRVAGALQAYYEWMPVRRVDAIEPRRNYRSFRLGDLADLVLLEERLSGREQQLPGLVTVQGASVAFAPLDALTNQDRQMLGAPQEAWLAQKLRSSTARWKLLGHGVMLSQFKLVGLPGAAPTTVYINPDQWDGYPAARTRIFDLVDSSSAPVANLVSLVADIHCSWSNDLARDPNSPLPQAGGYDPLTGAGAFAVEFVCTSVTAAGLESVAPLQSLVPLMNPQVRYVDFSRRGYMILDVTPERVVGEHWYVATVTKPDAQQSFGTAFAVADGHPHLSPTAETESRAGAPPPAP